MTNWLLLEEKWCLAAVQQIPQTKWVLLNKKKVVVENGCSNRGAKTSLQGMLLCGFNVMFNDSMPPPPPSLCLSLLQQEHYEGRHCQQQHSQHLPSQESCGAAEDGGLHGQDKGTLVYLFALLVSAMNKHIIFANLKRNSGIFKAGPCLYIFTCLKDSLI